MTEEELREAIWNLVMDAIGMTLSFFPHPTSLGMDNALKVMGVVQEDVDKIMEAVQAFNNGKDIKVDNDDYDDECPGCGVHCQCYPDEQEFLEGKGQERWDCT